MKALTTKHVVAILETMWDWRSMTSSAGYQKAPRYFRINPNNFSGRRLYKLIDGNGNLLVTNACMELASSAKEHGNPSPEWLAQNLQLMDVGGVEDHLNHTIQFNENVKQGKIDLLLVCGKVAQTTYKDCGYIPKNATVIEMPHPAARAYWNKETILARQMEIANALTEQAA